MVMKYVAPSVVNVEIETEIEKADTESEIQFWKNSLIMYVLGEAMSMNTMKNYMMKVWNYVQLPDMYYQDGGYLILKFKAIDEMDAILMKGPYYIRGMPMVLMELRLGFNFKTNMQITIPIWIKLPQLPLYLWGGETWVK